MNWVDVASMCGLSLKKFFDSVAPKIMKYVLKQNLFQDAFGKKNSKNLTIVWDHTTLPKTGLYPVGTSGHLGVKYLIYSILFNVSLHIK